MIIRAITGGPFSVNTYLMIEGDRAIAIDPGVEPGEILAALEGKTLIAIVCTHAHLDHVGAVEALVRATQAPFCIHKDDLPLLEQVPAQTRMFGLTPFAPPPPDRILADGDTIGESREDEQEPLRLTVIHTPGHTPGGICLLGKGVLFSGDTLFAGSVGRTDLPGGSHTQLIRSITDRLMTIEDSTIVYPGHGPQTSIGSERRGNPFL